MFSVSFVEIYGRNQFNDNDSFVVNIECPFLLIFVVMNDISFEVGLILHDIDLTRFDRS